jgi:hypothetical protein
MEVNGQLHALAALPRGKSLRYPLGRRLGGPNSRFGHGGEEKRSLHWPSRESNRGLPARSVVTILTELPRLSIYYGYCVTGTNIFIFLWSQIYAKDDQFRVHNWWTFLLLKVMQFHLPNMDFTLISVKELGLRG